MFPHFAALAEAPRRLGGADSAQPQELVAPPASTHDLNIARRDPDPLCDQLAQRVVGTVVDWRGGDFYRESATARADDFGARCARGKSDRDLGRPVVL
jgi:hypothetical protein